MSLSKLRHVRESTYIYIFMVFSAIIEVNSQINVEFQVGNVDANKDLSTLTRDIQQQLSIYNFRQCVQHECSELYCLL
jgi:hypothetical protein